MSITKQIDKLATLLILIIFLGIVLYTPMMVGMSNLFPDYGLLFKSWKEILIFLLAAITAVVIYRDGSYRQLFRDKIVVLVTIYCVLHILLAVLFFHGILVTIAGLMIDLRYIVFGLLVYVWALRYPGLRWYVLKVVIIGAFLVCGFALVQIFLLPYDALSYIGYNKDTVLPYLMVDNNRDFIRINSTLRGPNPLGAYSAIVVSLVCAWLASKRASTTRKRMWLSLLLAAGIITLWASYSRSALIAGAIGVAIVLVVRFLPKLSKSSLIIAPSLLVIVITSVAVASDTNLASHVLLHQDPTSGKQSVSNIQHVDSLKEGTERMLRQPLGGGVGSTGSASLRSSQPLIIENQYLFVAHEVGWLGLALFVMIFSGVMSRLWQRRQDYLALGVFASGIGLALIGLLLPVWVDDTVSIVWWGLAGLAVANGKIQDDK